VRLLFNDLPVKWFTFVGWRIQGAFFGFYTFFVELGNIIVVCIIGTCFLITFVEVKSSG
jgi:hypothetical protein